MLDPKEEEWLKRVLDDCFEKNSENLRNHNNLEAFRMLVTNLVKNIEKNVKEIRDLWEIEPKSKVLREKFSLLEKHLFYLRRFCKAK